MLSKKKKRRRRRHLSKIWISSFSVKVEGYDLSHVNCSPTKPQVAKAGQPFLQSRASLPSLLSHRPSFLLLWQPAMSGPANCMAWAARWCSKSSRQVGPDGELFRLDSDLQPQPHHLCVPKPVLSLVQRGGSYFPCQPAVDMSRTRRGEEAGDIGGPERDSTARHSPSSFTPRQEPEAPAGPDSRQCRRCWLPAAWLGKSSRGVGWGNSWKSQARGDESHRLWEICKLKGSGWGRSEVSQSGDTVGGRTLPARATGPQGPA